MQLTEREKAERIRAQYRADTAEVAADPDLTPDAKRRRSADIWAKTQRQLDELREAEAGRLSALERDLERKLFSTPTGRPGADPISTRDAHDRAAQLSTPLEASDLLARAELNADEALARAIARRAVEQSRTAPTKETSAAWDDVAASFLDARPSLMPVVEDLAQIERLHTRQLFSPFAIPKPYDVGNHDLNIAAADARAEAV